MTAYINGKEQEIYRNGAPQDAYVNGTQVHEFKKVWIFVPNNVQRYVYFADSIAEARSKTSLSQLKTFDVTASRAFYATFPLRFKGKFYLFNTSILQGPYYGSDVMYVVSFNDNLDVSTFRYGVSFSSMEGAPSDVSGLCGAFTSLDGQTLYVALGTANAQTVIMRSTDGVNYSFVTRVVARMIRPQSIVIPSLNGIILFSDTTLARPVFRFDTETFDYSAGIPNSAGSSSNCFLSRDQKILYSVLVTLANLNIPECVLFSYGTNVSNNTSAVCGECLYEGIPCVWGEGYSTHTNPVARNTLTFFETETGNFNIVAQFPQALRNIDTVRNGALQNHKCRSPYESTCMRSNASTIQSWTYVPYEHGENWEENSPYELGYWFPYYV